MSKILTACPVTGHPIDTGVEIDEASFARLPTFVGTVFCFSLWDKTRVVAGKGVGCGPQQVEILKNAKSCRRATVNAR